MYIFSFDVESDGLYGEGFAFGAVVMDLQGNIIDSAQVCCLENIESEWVQENVIPYLNDMPMVGTRKAVRDAFWQFYMHWKDQCHVFSDVAYPVEAEFLRRCVQENHGEWEAPFPLLDVASILFACGVDPLIDGAEFTNSIGNAHHPLFDACVSAKKLVCMIKQGKLCFS